MEGYQKSDLAPSPPSTRLSETSHRGLERQSASEDVSHSSRKEAVSSPADEAVGDAVSSKRRSSAEAFTLEIGVKPLTPTPPPTATATTTAPKPTTPPRNSTKSPRTEPQQNFEPSLSLSSVVPSPSPASGPVKAVSSTASTLDKSRVETRSASSKIVSEKPVDFVNFAHFSEDGSIKNSQSSVLDRSDPFAKKLPVTDVPETARQTSSGAAETAIGIEVKKSRSDTKSGALKLRTDPKFLEADKPVRLPRSPLKLSRKLAVPPTAKEPAGKKPGVLKVLRNRELRAARTEFVWFVGVLTVVYVIGSVVILSLTVYFHLQFSHANL